MGWKYPHCTIADCVRDHYSRGMCQAHYRRLQKTGSVGTHSIGAIPSARRKPRMPCTFPDCPYQSMSAGLCDAHSKQRSRGSVLKPIRVKTGPPLGRRESNLRSKYNITLAQFNEMVERQGGVCKICGAAPREGVRFHGDLHVDHDRACCSGWRSCGKCVRGLLCKMCNVGIGNLGDDPQRLESAAQYLRVWANR